MGVTANYNKSKRTVSTCFTSYEAPYILHFGSPTQTLIILFPSHWQPSAMTSERAKAIGLSRFETKLLSRQWSIKKNVSAYF